MARMKWHTVGPVVVGPGFEASPTRIPRYPQRRRVRRGLRGWREAVVSVPCAVCLARRFFMWLGWCMVLPGRRRFGLARDHRVGLLLLIEVIILVGSLPVYDKSPVAVEVVPAVCGSLPGGSPPAPRGAGRGNARRGRVNPVARTPPSVDCPSGWPLQCDVTEALSVVSCSCEVLAGGVTRAGLFGLQFSCARPGCWPRVPLRRELGGLFWLPIFRPTCCRWGNVAGRLRLAGVLPVC